MEIKEAKRIRDAVLFCKCHSSCVDCTYNNEPSCPNNERWVCEEAFHVLSESGRINMKVVEKATIRNGGK